MHSKNLNYLKVLVPITALLLLTACNSAIYFAQVNPEAPLQAGSLAVIAGSASPDDQAAAEKLTQRLEGSKYFKVVSQDSIRKKVDYYPCNIPFDESITYPVLFTPEGGKELAAMQTKLKVDYLFVVWARDKNIIIDMNSWTYVMAVYGNLISYPGSKVRAYTSAAHSRGKKAFKEMFATPTEVLDAIVGEIIGEVAEDMLEYSNATVGSNR